jgi:hypothetical protein
MFAALTSRKECLWRWFVVLYRESRAVWFEKQGLAV